MACIDYIWKEFRHKDIMDVVCWFKDKFNLRDWAITVDTGNEPPGDFAEDEESEKALARCTPTPMRFTAFIWIPLKRLKMNNVNAVQTVIHELLHVFCSARGVDIDTDSDNSPEERLVYSLEGPVFDLYCRECGRRIPKLRESSWAKIIA